MALSSYGTIVCIGPSHSAYTFSKIDPGAYFNHRVYNWSTTCQQISDNSTKCLCTYEFRFLLPPSLLSICQDFPSMKWKIDVLLEGRLEDWFELERFRKIPTVLASGRANLLSGSESIKCRVIVKDGLIHEHILIGEKTKIVIDNQFLFNNKGVNDQLLLLQEE